MAFAKTVDARDTENSRARIPSEKAIGCLRKAIIRLPNLYQVSFVLAKSLERRCQITHSDDDYNEATAILDELINFRGPGDTPSPFRDFFLKTAVQFSLNRFVASGKPEHVEQAIYLVRILVDGMSLEDPDRDWMIKYHTFFRELRFDGSIAAPKSESFLSSFSESGQLPSFRNLTASLPELSVNSLVLPRRLMTFFKHANALLPSSIDCRNDIADIEDGVNYCQQLAASYPDNTLAPFARLALARLLRRAFECTNQIEYLNRAILAGRDDVNTAKPSLTRSLSLKQLISALYIRLTLFNRREDLNEIMQLFRLQLKVHMKSLSACRIYVGGPS
jgi:hypothetical protein